MSCKNHPESPAAARCTGCAESYCENCLVEVEGLKYCGACKVMALHGRVPIIEDEGRRSKEARDALLLAFLSLFCFGIIVGPIAFVKASAAKKQMDRDPEILGRGTASAAQVVASVGVVLTLISIVVRLRGL